MSPSVPAISTAHCAPAFPCYVWNGILSHPTGLPSMWLRFLDAEAARDILPQVTHWLPITCDPQRGLRLDTPNVALAPLDPSAPTRKLHVTVDVPANWENRLDMQWVIEREIAADRWGWTWASERVMPASSPS